MVGFHMAKPLLHCIGKFIKSNVRFDILIETGTFDVKQLKKFSNGIHYVRSSRRMLTLPLALLKLKWNAFWEKTDANVFKTLSLISKDFQNDIQQIKKR